MPFVAAANVDVGVDVGVADVGDADVDVDVDVNVAAAVVVVVDIVAIVMSPLSRQNSRPSLSVSLAPSHAPCPRRTSVAVDVDGETTSMGSDAWQRCNVSLLSSQPDGWTGTMMDDDNDNVISRS